MMAIFKFCVPSSATAEMLAYRLSTVQMHHQNPESLVA